MPQPRVATEIDFIADYLDEQLTAVRYAAYGLSEEQARTTACASALSIGGLVKHVLWVMTENQRRDANPSGEMSQAEFREHAGEFTGSFALTDDENFADLVRTYEQTQAVLVAQIRTVDPDGAVMAPPQPWLGRLEPTATNGRFHLLHLIEEVARHAGHADIIREQLDGATAIELAFGIEGREGNEYVTPWQPDTP
ncbi:MAG: DUF664 domain-containing protein [Ornithinimicrobium sp.]